MLFTKQKSPFGGFRGTFACGTLQKMTASAAKSKAIYESLSKLDFIDLQYANRMLY